jgi:hypothetical protein
MFNRRSALPLVLIVCLCLTSCSSLAPSPTPTQTQPPTKTPTPSPTATKTPVPTPTLTPTPEPTPTSSCNPDEVLANLKALIPYEEFAVHHNIIGGLHTLAVWFVDPQLDPLAGGEVIGGNLDLAFVDAIQLSHLLNLEDPCIEVLFDVINPIVVDGAYNGWFSGMIEPSSLPREANLSERDIDQMEAAYTVGYLREVPTSSMDRPPAPTGSCTWQETKGKIWQHFAPSRQNVTFYFVIDEVGVNVWAQWDGPADMVIMSASLLNVVMELDCLYPTPDQLIVIVVDGMGEATLIGVLGGEAIQSGDYAEVLNQFQVVYP